MKELIAYIAQSLVDRPGEVSVSEVEGNQTTVLELKVSGPPRPQISPGEPACPRSGGR